MGYLSHQSDSVLWRKYESALFWVSASKYTHKLPTKSKMDVDGVERRTVQFWSAYIYIYARYIYCLIVASVHLKWTISNGWGLCKKEGRKTVLLKRLFQLEKDRFWRRTNFSTKQARISGRYSSALKTDSCAIGTNNGQKRTVRLNTAVR